MFWTAYYADGGPFIKQLREGGYQGLIAVGDGSNSPELFKLAGDAAEGVHRASRTRPPNSCPTPRRSPTPTQAKFGNAPGPLRDRSPMTA